MPNIVFASDGSYFDLTDAMLIHIPEEQFQDLIDNEEIEEHLSEAIEADVALKVENFTMNLDIPELGKED